MSASEQETVELYFHSGKEGGSFAFISKYNNLVVGLCNRSSCPHKCRQKNIFFRGGLLKVALIPRQSASNKTNLYVAHITNNINKQPAIDYEIAIAEGVGQDVNAMFYTDSKGKTLLVDCGMYRLDKHSEAYMSMQEQIKNLNIVGCIVTHAHYDHWNGLSGEMDFPIYVDPVALQFILRKAKIEEYSGKKIEIPQTIKTYLQNRFLKIGDFNILAVPTAHSIPNSSILFIETVDGKRIVHSGDFKFNGITWEDDLILTDYLRKFGKLGIDFMYCDNTNAHLPGMTPEENKAIKGVAEIIQKTEGRVIVSLFSSNLDRIEELVWWSKKLGRKVSFAGGAMRFAHKLLSEKKFIPYEKTPDEETVVFATGCQSETGSILYKEVTPNNDMEPELFVDEYDTIILSSRAIPGNEEAISKMIGSLLDAGCTVYMQENEIQYLQIEPQTRLHEAFVHVSGHGKSGDIIKALDLVRPISVIPSFTNGPQFASITNIATEMGIEMIVPKNNQLLL